MVTFISKRRFCRFGAGFEATAGSCNTPGFPFNIKDVLEFDARGYRYINLKRCISERLCQSSMIMLQSWRANCDVKILLYDTDPMCPDLREIANVAGYVVAYTCKGHIMLKQEREIICSSIKRCVICKQVEQLFTSMIFILLM